MDICELVNYCRSQGNALLIEGKMMPTVEATNLAVAAIGKYCYL